jgi:hypothetical protein
MLSKQARHRKVKAPELIDGKVDKWIASNLGLRHLTLGITGRANDTGHPYEAVSARSGACLCWASF